MGEYPSFAFDFSNLVLGDGKTKMNILHFQFFNDFINEKYEVFF